MKRAVCALVWPLMAAACAAPRPSPAAPPPAAPPEAWPTAPPPAPGLYSAQEALRDVLSGDLEYVGTGRWPGVERARACAFRNERILIVNAYCTLQEAQAFRIEVYSPQRGRVRIYAETRGVVSARQRPDYFTFTVESSPAPAADAGLPVFTLAMPYEELRRYEQQRYDAYLPGCFGGVQNERPILGCLGTLAARQRDWEEQNRAFWDYANDDWYQVVRQLRALATRYGAHPED